MANRDQGGFVANGELNGVLSDSLMWNTIVGIKRATLDQLPITGPDVMSHWSYASGLFTQNYDRQELSSRASASRGTSPATPPISCAATGAASCTRPTRRCRAS